MGYNCVSLILTILLVVITWPVVYGNDATPIPQNKNRIEQWFNTNVPSLASRKDKLDPALLTAEATPRVRQNGRGDFNTLTEAINSVPVGNNERVIIKLGHGEYKEKVTIDRNKPFITLYGDPNAMPVLTFDGTAAEYGTVDSATLIVLSDYFMAINIIVKLSITVNSMVIKTRFVMTLETISSKTVTSKGHLISSLGADALYTSYSTQLNVVGDGLRVITAHAGKSTEEKSGYSFVHCKVTGTGTGIYLGRAWMSHPKVVYAYTDMSSVVNPSGWHENTQTERDKTVFYGEYKCSGPGSLKEKRVKYTQDIDNIEANSFISLGYIQGSSWLLPPPFSINREINPKTRMKMKVIVPGSKLIRGISRERKILMGLTPRIAAISISGFALVKAACYTLRHEDLRNQKSSLSPRERQVYSELVRVKEASPMAIWGSSSALVFSAEFFICPSIESHFRGPKAVCIGFTGFATFSVKFFDRH
ncbi:hypothetical protein F2Q70_00032527, partial [Brassica cretica]